LRPRGSLAIRIATAKTDEIQTALSEAYTKGDLRGAKLRAIHRLIANRSLQLNASTDTAKLSREELVKEYELQTERHRHLSRGQQLSANAWRTETTNMRKVKEEYSV